MSIYVKAISPTHLIFEDHALSVVLVLKKAIEDRQGDYESLQNLEAQLEYMLVDVRRHLEASNQSKWVKILSRLKVAWNA